MTNVDVALLLSEWEGGEVLYGDLENFCPVCWAPATQAKHEPGCAMDLALAERGYPTQVERDAARARLKAAAEPTIPPPASGKK